MLCLDEYSQRERQYFRSNARIVTKVRRPRIATSVSLTPFQRFAIQVKYGVDLEMEVDYMDHDCSQERRHLRGLGTSMSEEQMDRIVGQRWNDSHQVVSSFVTALFNCGLQFVYILNRMNGNCTHCLQRASQARTLWLLVAMVSEAEPVKPLRLSRFWLKTVMTTTMRIVQTYR
jgi:hypothetical protein